MKKICIIILFIPLFSCNSFLNVEPENSVTFTNYFKDEAEIEALYTNLLVMERSALAPIESTIHEIMGLYCDDIYVNIQRVEGNVATRFKALDAALFLNENIDSYINWKGLYDIIYISNMMVDNEYRFQQITPERTGFWLAQAWFARALCYFNIARTWGDAPIVPNSEYKGTLGKSSVKEVLAEALRCAEKALVLPPYDSPEMVNARGKALTSRQYGNLGTVYTLMANIYAWRGGLYNDEEDWKKAEEYASLVIDGKAGYYRLEPMSTFCQNVLGDTRKSDEVIFTIEINSIDRNYFNESTEWDFFPGQLLITYPIKEDAFNDVVEKYAIAGGVSARIRTSRVMNLYPEPNDLRRTQFWDSLGMERNNNGKDTYAYLYKWRKPIYSVNEEAKNPYLGVEGNKVIWRLADLMLLRAECRARLGMATAVEDLNKIRARAGLGNYSGNGDLRKEIFRERERELFGEGQRYYDAVRNGYYAEISSDMSTLSADEIAKGAIYLPVSREAFTSNTLMRQNTYWSWKK